MFAGQIFEPGKIRLIDVPEPLLRSGDELGQIIFQPELGCLCGSDLLFFESRDDENKPEVGHSLHEIIGRVVQTNGKRFRSGERVLCVPDRQRGLFERFRESEQRAIRLDERPPRAHALLSQPLGTVICALKKIGCVLDLNVAVVGQGPIGQLFCAALRNLGARDIIAIDRLASRLAKSFCMGATTVVHTHRQDPVEVVGQITGGTMADLVVDAAGHDIAPLNLCIDLCRPSGRILAFGIPPAKTDEILWKDVFLKGITLQSSFGPDFERDFPLAMRWISEGRIDVAPLLTHRFPVSSIQQAFDLFRDRKDGVLKVLIEFPTENSASV